MTSPSVDSLVVRTLDAYWSLENNSKTMTSPDRMGPVIRCIAEEIRTWAPPKEQARICHLAINEVADRLIAESTTTIHP